MSTCFFGAAALQEQAGGGWRRCAGDGEGEQEGVRDAHRRAFSPGAKEPQTDKSEEDGSSDVGSMCPRGVLAPWLSLWLDAWIAACNFTFKSSMSFKLR